MSIEYRELTNDEDLYECVAMQSKVFNLPTIELSPVRHFIITKHAGGFTLGAFSGGDLVGFCLSVPAVLDGKPALYSHMTAVLGEFQNAGIGYQLKLEQRKLALTRGIDLIKWTFQPEKSRNAYFNLEKLGAEVSEYMPDFYGTDYGSETKQEVPIRSDRLFAIWRLNSEKATVLAEGNEYVESRPIAREVEAIPDWESLLDEDRVTASRTQQRLREDLEAAFAANLVCQGFTKPPGPKYLFFEKDRR